MIHKNMRKLSDYETLCGNMRPKTKMSSRNNNYCSTSSRKGMSLIEVMVGMVIFVLIFTYTFKAFAPTATDAHSLLRGVTVAMNACNWYLNELEKQINYRGSLPDSELGERDVTSVFRMLNVGGDKPMFSDLDMLRNLRATSNVVLNDNLYKMKIEFRWGNHDRDDSRPHNYSLYRLKSKPGF